MIETVADLLNDLKEKELKLNKKYEVVKHPGIIGEMYEGLTEKILNKSVFSDLDLRVVSGKIKNKNNSYSDEIDCMLVEGKGDKIPNTKNRYIYDINQVIAVIQVKKNLYSKDLKSGIDNIKSVLEIKDLDYYDKYIDKLTRTAFKLICKKDFYNVNKNIISENEKNIYHMLRMDAFYPITIIWGYYGFSSEAKFRQAYYNFLSNKINKKGYSPSKLPNLIICNDYSLFKLNGMPFGTGLTEDGYWPIYASSHINAVYYFLEILWTRISFKYQLSYTIFGEDLKIDQGNLFMKCKLLNKNGKKGWEYICPKFSNDTLNRELERKDWEPVYLNEVQATIINRLCLGEEVNINDESLKKYINNNGYNVDQIVEELIETELVYLDNSKLKLLTDYCNLVITPEGEYVAADNKTGRLTRWLNKQREES